MAPRFWTNPFRRDAEMERIVAKRGLGVVVSYLATEPAPRVEQLVEASYSGGHVAFTHETLGDPLE